MRRLCSVLWLVCLGLSMGILYPSLTTAQAPATVLRLHVLNSQSQPMRGVQLDFLLGQESRSMTTNDQGMIEVVLPESVTTIFIEGGIDQGQAVAVEQNTPDGVMRIAAIPQQTRTVILLLDQGVIAMTPESLFAGIDPTTGVPIAPLPTIDGSLPPQPSIVVSAATVESIQNQTDTQDIPISAATSTPLLPILVAPNDAQPSTASSSSRFSWIICGIGILVVVVLMLIVLFTRERRRQHIRLQAYYRRAEIDANKD